MWRWSTSRAARCCPTSSSASAPGASRSRATRRPSTSPTVLATTSRSSTPRVARRSSRSPSAACRGGSRSMIDPVRKLRCLGPLPRLRGREPAVGVACTLFFLALFFAAVPAAAQDAPRQTLTIGYVEIANDPRYDPIKGADRIVLKTRAHPYPGAEVSIDDAAALRRVLPVDFALARISVKSVDEVAAAVLRAIDGGTHFFLIDAPASAFVPLAAAVRGRDALLFNVSAP